MVRDSENEPLTRPWVYVIRMAVFIVLGLLIAAILTRSIMQAFAANPPLNGLIVGVLLIGVFLAFKQVMKLFNEIEWANHFLKSDTGIVIQKSPDLLLPMARLLSGRSRRDALTPTNLRVVLDSVSARLDEARDTGRYLTALLVFLGLLGTFWGLLETVGSVGKVITSMKSGSDAALMFEELKTGLAAPLSGMGISFSSSLFGLAGSLVLGFLDLQAGQAQNKFFTELEDWLSGMTGPASSAEFEGALASSAEVRVVLDRITPSLVDAGSVQAINRLADGVEGLVKNMRGEQQMIRDWVEAQAAKDDELRALIQRLMAERK